MPIRTAYFFTATQAAQKDSIVDQLASKIFTATQAAQKFLLAILPHLYHFTATQAAQKTKRGAR